MLPFLARVILFLLLPATLLAQTVDLEQRVRSIAEELRCVVCQNLSVADSPSELAQQMRDIIREQLKEGKSPEQIKAYFVSKYGDWVLLAPPRRGFSLLLWVLPFVAAVAGLVLVFFVVRRWVERKKSLEPLRVDTELLARIEQEVTAETEAITDVESNSPRAILLREQARCYGDIRELDFDFQAGRLSENDYRELRRDLEAQAVRVLKELETTPPAPDRQTAESTARSTSPQARQADEQRPYRGWKLAAGGLILLVFGGTLGVLLSQSLRPRLTEQDTITGGFLTGTGPSKNVQTLLTQGRSSFEREDWPRAIEAFKEALQLDPNQSEAHSYMGLILARAGHPDGALLAFDRALEKDPDFPLALWGKGMLLFRGKGDLAGAQRTLQKLSTLMPPGAEKSQVEMTLAEIAELQRGEKTAITKAEAGSKNAHPQEIRGAISIDPTLQSKIDSRAVLFIMARSANASGGPPLAVKKIDRPTFPLSYSLGPENVMMPGVPFMGNVFISARLDKDGNPMTREPGNLVGEYLKNPVEVGSQKVDIVIDRVM